MMQVLFTAYIKEVSQQKVASLFKSCLHTTYRYLTHRPSPLTLRYPSPLTLVMTIAVPVSAPPTILIPHGVFADGRRRVTPNVWGFVPPRAALILWLVTISLTCSCYTSANMGESALIVSLYASTARHIKVASNFVTKCVEHRAPCYTIL
jgi:hypothetical protein